MSPKDAAGPHASANVDGLISYLDSSPSPWHAVASTLALLGGCEVIDEHDAWNQLPRFGAVVRDAAVVAWKLPADVGQFDATTPFRLVGAHTDSPCLRIKPQPDMESCGWKQLDIEVYGGILNNTWLDRDLGIAGRVIGSDASSQLINVAEPVARVPQLAVHLDRGVNDNGLLLDRQQHLTPVWGTGAATRGGFANWLAETSGLDEIPTWWDLCLYDLQGARVLGADSSMLASGRLDNLLSCWAATQALDAAEPSDHVAMIVLNDHEEVGSASATGAAGPLLETVIDRIVRACGGSTDDRHRALAGSMCVSADNAHAVHPNYPDRHDPAHLPMINAGPALKVNANQRYATSPVTAHAFQAACEQAGVPWQVFVSRNNMPCGSTIGPITATRLGIATADVGVPQLSMHSARELCGAADPGYLTRAVQAFLS